MNDRFEEIPSRIDYTLGVLDEMLRRLDSFETETLPLLGETNTSVLIPVQIIENTYTALETLFLRISQAFENNLSSARWHTHLLEKMLLEIPSTRAAVISQETFRDLRELMRFRHFNRYYFELDYDWEKINFLVKTLRRTAPRVRAELSAFGDTIRLALSESENNAG